MGHRALAIISSYLAGFIQVQDEMTRLLTVSAASTLSSHDSALLQRTLYMSYPCLGTLGFIIQSLSIDEAILVVPDSDVSHQLFPPSSLSVSRCPCSCCLLVWDRVVSSAFIGSLFFSPIGLAMSKPCKLLGCLSVNVSHQSEFDPMAVSNEPQTLLAILACKVQHNLMLKVQVRR